MYLSEKELHTEDKTAHRIVMESRHFELIDGVLYHETAHFPGRWCIAVLASLKKCLWQDAHGGVFAGHLIYDRLRRDYWWPGMKKDVRVHCRSCLTCAHRKNTGRASHPPLQLIKVNWWSLPLYWWGFVAIAKMETSTLLCSLTI